MVSETAALENLGYNTREENLVEIFLWRVYEGGVEQGS